MTQELEVLLSNFGNVKLSLLHDNLMHSGSMPDDEFAKSYISYYVKGVLKNSILDINHVCLQNCVLKYVASKSAIFDQLVTGVYSELLGFTKQIQQNIQECINGDIFSVNSFSALKKQYDGLNFWHFSKMLSDYVSIDEKDVLKILKDYAFYSNVLNNKYQYCDQTLYLFSVLKQLLDTFDSRGVLHVYRLYNQYRGFSFSLADKTKRSVLFNPELDESFCCKLTSEQLQYFVHDVNNLVTDLSDKLAPENCNASQEVNDLVDIVEMCQKIGNPKEFLAAYKKALQKRLLDGRSLINIENVLANSMLFASAPEEVINIHYSINDIAGCKFINNEYQSIEVKCTSGKYSDSVMNDFDAKRAKFTILRSFVWDNVKIEDTFAQLVPPQCLSIYSESFKRFYEEYFDRFCPRSACRTVDYCYRSSFVDLDINNGTDVCSAHMTFLQACVLVYIIENENLTAQDLANLMNIPLKFIEPEINSLLCGFIIDRDENYDKTDTMMRFSISKEFCYNSHFDFTHFFDEACSDQDTAEDIDVETLLVPQQLIPTDDIKDKVEIQPDSEDDIDDEV